MTYQEWVYSYMCSIAKSDETTISDIIDAIENGKPLSYTRFADGELQLLKEYFNIIKNNPRHITLSDADSYVDIIPEWNVPNKSAFAFYTTRYHNNVIHENYFKNRFNVSDPFLKKQITKIIGESLLYGLQNSTHIGIWDAHKMINNIPFLSFCGHMHSYFPHKELFNECDVDFNKLTSALINRKDVFSNLLKFKKILDGRHIHIITSNEERLKNITKIHEILNTNITYTNITLVKRDWKTHSFANHDYLYNRCKDIKEHIVLYGLGYGAKNIPSYLSSNYGKCVIDMGAVLDGWAGKITRPYMKGDESHMVIDNSNIIESYPWDGNNDKY